MSNIMIIYPKPDIDKKSRFGFSYDLMIIATILSDRGHNTYIRDFSCQNYNKSEFISEITNKKIDMAVIEFDSFSLKRSENCTHGRKLVKIIKEINTEIAVVTYGHFLSISKTDIPQADYKIKENNLNQIIKATNEIYNPARPIPLISDFDCVPFINRKLLMEIDYYRNNNKSTLIQTSTGCENTCVFCQRKGWQKKYQTHSDNYVQKEFALLKKSGYVNVWVVDENFTYNLNRAKRILNLLINNKVTKEMKLFISSWANIDTEFLDLASQANIKAISFGIESGNQDILDFYKKNIDLEKTKSMIKYANSIGIFTIGNFIIGAPMESDITINETFRYIRECAFDQVNIKTLDYMMGSDLFNSIKHTNGCSHMFACLENGLNKYTLKEITEIKSRFLNEYYQENNNRIKSKIHEYGTPYEVNQIF
jgi:tRNA A37 methylthiotransferase MiaB